MANIHFANTTGDEVGNALFSCLQDLTELRERVSSVVGGCSERGSESSLLQEFLTKHSALVAELKKLAAEATGNGLRSTDGGNYHVSIGSVNYR